MPESNKSFWNVFFGKRPPQPLPQSPEQLRAPAQESLPQQLESMSDSEFTNATNSLNERDAVRLLQSTENKELQLRIVNAITNQPVLKKISRSQLDKKLRRLAQRKLTDSAEQLLAQKTGQLANLSGKIQSFLNSPNWSEARLLLDEAFDPALEAHDSPFKVTENPFLDFVKLRNRLKAEVLEYEHTCAEMDRICAEIEPSRNISKAKLEELKDRWLDLEEKYRFPADFEVIGLFHNYLAQRSSSRPVRKPEKDQQREAARQRADQQKKDQQQAALKLAEERKARESNFASILNKLENARAQLGNPSTGTLLRNLQKQLSELKRWKGEFRTEFETAEERLKELLAKNSEASNEARWSAWARTDQAQRIEKELQARITAIETENDPIDAVHKARGLAQAIYDASNEMKKLGSLERDKDHKIWEEFKALCDRGLTVCDQMRASTLEQLKATLAEHLAKPFEFTRDTLSNPKAPPEFKLSAFTESVTGRVRDLQASWSEIGARRSDVNRETEAVFTRLFEQYFRQLNLHLGHVQRIERGAIQRKQDLLLQLNKLGEGPGDILDKLRTAKVIHQKWKRESLPDSARVELEKLYEEARSRLNQQVNEALRAQAQECSDRIEKARDILQQITQKTGMSPNSGLAMIGTLEQQATVCERSLAQIQGNAPTSDPACAESAADCQERLQELRGELTAVREAIQTIAFQRTNARRALLGEAEALAITPDALARQGDFDALKARWKQAGPSGQPEDTGFELLFEHLCDFFASRLEFALSAKAPDEKSLKLRKELLLALEALSKFQPNANAGAPLPFNESEKAGTAGKLLELGMKYRRIFSLDPNALGKETKSIMKEWARLGITDEALPRYWPYYLNRLRLLLGL